ncbi:hypothetical protein [Nonomuraea sp. NPDC049646]|uniref:hypothetical protein n=1 Tax=unclassified Nonomuraea TaxID=2593643 RepID=UPI0037A67649
MNVVHARYTLAMTTITMALILVTGFYATGNLFQTVLWSGILCAVCLYRNDSGVAFAVRMMLMVITIVTALGNYPANEPMTGTSGLKVLVVMLLSVAMVILTQVRAGIFFRRD